MTITLHHGDIPVGLDFGSAVAVDTETMGLSLARDRLCLVQLSAGDGTAHLVQFAAGVYEAPRLKKLLADPKVTKIFHFARFDIAFLYAHLGVLTGPVYCTKIASKLVRTYAPHHGLKALCSTLLDVDLDKQQQTTDWGAKDLTPEQLSYAASDVLYLHRLRDKLQLLLQREGREQLAQACFDFLPHRALLDLAGWDEEDIFVH